MTEHANSLQPNSRAQQIEWLALRISPEREGFAWRECPQSGDGVKHYPPFPPYLCDLCHGTGRVPAPLDGPASTWSLLAWLSLRPWYDSVHYWWQEDDAGGMDDADGSAKDVFAWGYKNECAWAKEHGERNGQLDK